MKVAILGCRGIPNKYGGFEQFAEKLATRLAGKGVDVTVYNTHHHPFKGEIYEGVNIIHKYDPVRLMGSMGQYFYDLLCIADSRKRNFDIIYQLGYATSAIWFGISPRNSILITNVDGQEWARAKYNKVLKKIIKKAEKKAVGYSDVIVADSLPMRDHIISEYDTGAEYISYGSELTHNPDIALTTGAGLTQNGFYLAIARFVPENNLEKIIEGCLQSGSELPLVLIGNFSNAYGKSLKEKYAGEKVIFKGPVFDMELLASLRAFCRLYFHGHSAGGTNPSLLEAMGAGALICAHNNIFNKDVLRGNAFYFDDVSDISTAIEKASDDLTYAPWKKDNIKNIEEHYSWEKITNSYYELFLSCLKRNNE